MVKYFIIFIVLLAQLPSFSRGGYNYDTHEYEMAHPIAYYLPENWPSYTIKLTKEGRLKELFDAGLKPGFTGMLQRRELSLKHVNVKFLLSDGRELPEFAAERVQVTVTKAGLLRLNFVSQPMSFAEAKMNMKQWMPFFSEKRKKTEDQLEDYLNKAAADPLGYDDRDFGAAPEGFGGGWKDKNDLGYGVSFQKAWNEVLPVRMHFNVIWHYVRTKKERKNFYDVEIPSPAGYTIPTIKDWGPDSVMEMMHAKGIAFPEGMSLAGENGKIIEPKEREEKPIQEIKSQSKHEPEKEELPAPEADKKPNHLPLIITGIVLLFLIALIIKIVKVNK